MRGREGKMFIFTYCIAHRPMIRIYLYIVGHTLQSSFCVWHLNELFPAGHVGQRSSYCGWESHDWQRLRNTFDSYPASMWKIYHVNSDLMNFTLVFLFILLAIFKFYFVIKGVLFRSHLGKCWWPGDHVHFWFCFFYSVCL